MIQVSLKCRCWHPRYVTSGELIPQCHVHFASFILPANNYGTQFVSINSLAIYYHTLSLDSTVAIVFVY